MNQHRRKRLKRGWAKRRPLLMPMERDRAHVRRLTVELTGAIEPMLSSNCHGYRPRRNCDTAHAHVANLDGPLTKFDIRNFYPNIDHQRLRRHLNRIDPEWWYRLWPWIPQRGLAMGVAFSPVLSNLYLHEIDRRFPNAVRYADDIMIVAGDPRPIIGQLNDIGLRVHDVDACPTRWLGAPVDLDRTPTGAPS